MAKVSQASIAMLKGAGCNEVEDDEIAIGTTDVRVSSSGRAEQARKRVDNDN